MRSGTLRRMTLRRELVLVLAAALAVGAMVVLVGRLARWDPFVTGGLAIVAAAMVTGWAPLEPGPPPGEGGDPPDPRRSSCCGAPADAPAQAHAHGQAPAPRSRSGSAG